MQSIGTISAVILAGGLARRLNGVEKGLQYVAGKTLISHILRAISPQVSDIWLNINRSHALYAEQFPQLPFYSDELADFQGPLSGMLSAFSHIERDYLLFVPCDTPFLPPDLLVKLATALRINGADIAYAHDGERAHPTIALVSRAIQPQLAAYLAQGERRLLQFFMTQKSVAVDFSAQAAAFQNFNSPEDFCKERAQLPRLFPDLLGVTGYSGTGKTTLLEKLIPILIQRGVRIGLIKHSHHNVEVDKAGKDSHRLRLAGANPTMIACEQRWALMTETDTLADFTDLVRKFDPSAVDLVLVEGFKHEQLPKIQLHRKDLAKPLPESDEFTLAVATDYPLSVKNHLDINNITEIADFIMGYFQLNK